MEYDVFICHASEDKQDFVKPLADALVKQNLKVWYDEFELTLGDSLREKIDYGLANSRYGVVVLSKNFFRKKWPKEELDGLAARQTSEGKKVMLPMWYKVSYEDVKQFSPVLAGKLAAKSDEGIQTVVAKLLAVVKREASAHGGPVFERRRQTGMGMKIDTQAIAIEEKVIEIISEQMGVDKSEITRETSFINDLNADSLDTVEFVMLFEDEFDMIIPDEEAEKIKTVGDAIYYIINAAQSKKL